MKTLIALWGAALFFSLVARAGNLAGTVRAQGKEGAPTDPGDRKYGSRKYKFAERLDYSELRDFVVFIDGPLGTNAAPARPLQVVTTRKINQKGAAFSPHVLPVMVGTTVEWPNEDDIFHNVFSISEAKQFDLDLYKHPVVKRVTFDKPGRVDAFCSIHKAMNCVILVLENPYFAATDDQGRYLIANVPPGTYKLKAWHERLPAMVKDITVPERGDVRLDFTLGILNLPKY
jgi:plastocyanin